MRKIEQTKWHIQDQIRPSHGRFIKQIMDIYTDEQFFFIPLKNFSLIKLKVINRLNNNELPYTECKDGINVNLGNLNSWPKSKKHSYHVKHVKLQIEYTLLNPPFKESYKYFLRERIVYKGGFDIDDLIQPEFYITLPRGLRLKKKGKSTTMLLFVNFGNNTKLKKILDNSGLSIKYSDENISGYKLSYDGPYIQKNSKKESYSYLIKDNDYKILKNHDKELKDSLIIFVLNYKVNYDWHLFGTIIAIGVSILIVGIFRVWYLLKSGGDGTFTTPYIIVFLSYIALLLKYHDDEYNLPIIPLIIVSLIIFVIWVLFEFFCMTPHNSSFINCLTKLLPLHN